MVYKIVISTHQNKKSNQYAEAVKASLFRMNEFPIAAVSSTDMSLDGSDDLSRGDRTVLQNADIFIGIYDANYDILPPNETRSVAEDEYYFAHQNGIMCLIFMPDDIRDLNDDGLMSRFKGHLQQNHVINYFANTDDLTSQVKLAVSNYKKTNKHRRVLRPPAPSFRDSSAPSRPRPPFGRGENESEEEALSLTNETFPDLVDQAMDYATNELENIIRRALELHDASNQQNDPVYSEMDGIVHARPIFGEPMRQSQFMSDIFMIMPFREKYNKIYTDVVRPTVSELNLTMKRGDEFNSVEGSIMREVWSAIHGCRLCIVETSEINANVYYELGIAHTLGKPAILLTQHHNITDWPFDIRHLRFVVYDDTDEGRIDLEKKLKQQLLWILNDLEAREVESTD